MHFQDDNMKGIIEVTDCGKQGCQNENHSCQYTGYFSIRIFVPRNVQKIGALLDMTRGVMCAVWV
jgi:hypothetical protein